MGSDIKKFVNPKFLNSIDRRAHARPLRAPFQGRRSPGRVRGGRRRSSQTDDRLFRDTDHRLVRRADRGSASGRRTWNRRRNAAHPERGHGAKALSSIPSPTTEEADSAAGKARAQACGAARLSASSLRIFEAAADFQALRAPTAMAEFRGPRARCRSRSDRGGIGGIQGRHREAVRAGPAGRLLPSRPL